MTKSLPIIALLLFLCWSILADTPTEIPICTTEQLDFHKHAKPESVFHFSLLLDTLQVAKFRCPPCGCRQDHKEFSKPGFCLSCDMPLVPVNTGIAAELDQWIGPAFEDRALGKIYPKFIYPIFAAGILFSLLQLVFFRRRKTLNGFLAGLLLCLSLYGFKNQLYGVSDGFSANYKFLFTPISFILLIGPLFYFYVKSVLESDFKWNKRYWLHMVPAAMVFVSYLTLLFMPSAVQQATLSSPFEVIFSHWEQIGSILAGSVYLVFSANLMRTWKKTRANPAPKLGLWLSRLSLSLGGLFAIWGLCMLFNYHLYSMEVTTLTYNPLWVYLSILLLGVAMYITSNPSFFFTNHYQSSSAANIHSIFNEAELHQLEAKLKSLMTEQKFYREADLGLDSLASELDINPKQLSHLLNNNIGRNFYDFINFYRVEEVKKLLQDPANNYLTIEAMANQVGFKSKSTFYTAFKKQTNMTPGTYMKQLSVSNN